jgi:translin
MRCRGFHGSCREEKNLAHDSGQSFASIAEEARTALDASNVARERALKDSRELIRLCATAIRAAHRGEVANSSDLLTQAITRHEEIRTYLTEHPVVYWAGYVQDAEKELAEAAAVCAALRGDPLPLPSQLGIGVPPFLNGLGEAVGELRRYLLDRLRAGEPGRGELLLELMEEIYGLLVSLDYPDGLTGGLRRTTDGVRGILERTRGDWTAALLQLRLTEALRCPDTTAP